jgi:endonuclease YncB( thermonuclease family)/Ca2+-binding RTX toxin-like protein
MATISGTNNADTRYGTTGADLIYGYGGNDSLYGRAGDDQIWGGLGSDSLFGETGNDTLRGEDAADFLYGSDGNDTLHGGIGDDSLHGDAGTDTVRGDAGNDIVKGGYGISYLYGGDGTDTLYYNPTTDNIANVRQYLSPSLLDGDAGTDTLNLFNEAKYTQDGVVRAAATDISMDGTIGRILFENPVTGTSSSVGQFLDMEKVTVAGAGRLEFTGSSYSGPGIDITGTAGADVFTSRSASDTMRGGGGNDTINGQGGNDWIDGGIGNDKVDGGAGNDTLYGGDGADALFGGAGADYMDGGIGDDTLRGADLDDLAGGAGNDRLTFRIDGHYEDLWEGEPDDPPPAPYATLDGGTGRPAGGRRRPGGRVQPQVRGAVPLVVGRGRRSRGGAAMKTPTPAVIALLAVLVGCTPSTGDLVGRVGGVHDGDTLTLSGAKVRLWGIDAPELDQQCDDARGRQYRCGIHAREALETMVRNRDITCRQHDRDRYGRVVALCEVEGQDVGRLMVRTGHAVDYRRYSGGRYELDQRRAREERTGIWAGTFTMPSEWRRER